MMSILNRLLNIIIPRDNHSGDSYLSRGYLNNPIKKENLLICSQDIEVFDLIKRAKIGGQYDITYDLVNIARNSIGKYNLNFDFITFTPPDPLRIKLRGYHIPKLIAKKLSTIFSVDYKQVVDKKFHTKSQGSLSKSERLSNNITAFKINNSIKISDDSKILLIDDIYTTGSTLNQIETIIKSKFPHVKIYKICIYGRDLNTFE